jgi:hypothetical protein
MSKLERLGLAVATSVALAGCAGARPAPFEPFKVARDAFYPSLKVIALAPLRVPSDLENPDPVRRKFAEMIEHELRSSGLQVVVPAEVGPVLDAARADAGPLFDPATGKPIEAKVKALNEDVLQRVKARFGADAVLWVDLRVVMARLDHDTAAWDGVFESAGTGTMKRLVSGTHSGRVPALSLVAHLVRVDGTELYANTGGLRVISRVGMGGAVERVPRDELFADETRNATAVHLVVDPLLGRRFQPAQGGTVDPRRL